MDKLKDNNTNEMDGKIECKLSTLQEKRAGAVEAREENLTSFKKKIKELLSRE